VTDQRFPAGCGPCCRRQSSAPEQSSARRPLESNGRYRAPIGCRFSGTGSATYTYRHAEPASRSDVAAPVCMMACACGVAVPFGRLLYPCACGWHLAEPVVRAVAVSNTNQWRGRPAVRVSGSIWPTIARASTLPSRSILRPAQHPGIGIMAVRSHPCSDRFPDRTLLADAAGPNNAIYVL